MKQFIIILALICSICGLVLGQDTATAGQKELDELNSNVTKLFKEEKFAEADVLAEKAVVSSETNFGQQSVETARTLANRGFVQIKLNALKKAEETLERSVEIFKKLATLDKMSEESYVNSLYRLGMIKGREDINKGEKYFTEVVERSKANDTGDSLRTGRALAMLANIYFWRGDFKTAAEMNKRGLGIFVKHKESGPDNILLRERAACSFRKAGLENDPDASAALASFIKIPKVSVDVIRSGIVNGKATSLAKPHVTQNMRGSENTKVEVEILVDEHGVVISACAASPAVGDFADAAEKAAYASKFSPTTLQGKPVKVIGKLHYMFIFHM